MTSVTNIPGEPTNPAALPQGTNAPRPKDLAPGLYLVATPIGNLRDITLRALDVLGGVDRVLAEDTRMSRRLFDAYGLRPKCEAYHEHNADQRRDSVLEALEQGSKIALISDAGTPLISDPGYKLVREAAKRDVAVYAIPGPSAALAALTVSGLPTDKFLFAGFLPPRQSARRRALEALKSTPASLVFYETAKRVLAVLEDMNTVLGPRDAVLARELTKRFETLYRAPLDQLASQIPESELRGEMVLVIGPPDDEELWDEAQIDAALTEALAHQRLKSAVDEITKMSGQPRRLVYRRALDLQKQS
ncbi:MAG: 16S rRNA (cytidine(1402)-2'-O)-methyltransferase [Robiginitomaculum sp.]|nr:16S rRNA (cytidine(1402)-2'-O)-methyltransferase [Robiginitomaculum sp.]MDQ7078797.1 16S rRNA (cytidine(1402)-2'-O)-methyltransferase [Robiginitomaculum sp.]